MKVSRHLSLVPVLALALLVLPFLLVACGNDDDDNGDDAATATTAPTEEPEGTADTGDDATATSEPEDEDASTGDGEYPRTVQDLLGRDVEIPAAPERVVALSPTAVEFVYAVGGSVVGRSDTATYPPEVQDVEAVGTAYQPNLEAILALDPDLIVADSVIHAQPQLRSSIEELPVPVVFAGATSYQNAIDGLELIGEVLGAEDAAADQIASIESDLEEARSMVEGLDTSAVVLIGDRDRVLYAANSGSYPGDLLTLLDIENPFSDEPDSGPFPGYSNVPTDLLLSADPGNVLTLSPAPPPAPELSSVLGMMPGLEGLTAVQEGTVTELDVELMVQASGPRVGEALLSIAEAVAGN